MNAHPELMSKPVLVSLVKAADVRIAAARAETERMRVQAEYWRRYADEVAARASTHRYDPILETERAQMMLDALGPDPEAPEHLATLAAATARKPTIRARRPGPRCARPRCHKLLDDDGLCCRCDWKKRRANRERVAA